MDEVLADHLNQINKRFYAAVADEFSESRSAPWPGWEGLVEYLEQKIYEKGVIGVLDVGCGNGRFGEFLAKRFGKMVEYTGIDSSGELIELAKKRLEGMGCRLIRGDVIDNKLSELVGDEKHDVAALFGVMHHVPGRESRRQLLLEVVNLLNEKGLLMVSFWQFLGSERFRKKIIPISEFAKSSNEVINLAELEKGDVMLGWKDREGLVRYCHHFEDDEVDELVGDIGLEAEGDFKADGAEGKLNSYVVLTKK